jgi:hypothetical protein
VGILYRIGTFVLVLVTVGGFGVIGWASVSAYADNREITVSDVRRFCMRNSDRCYVDIWGNYVIKGM